MSKIDQLIERHKINLKTLEAQDKEIRSKEYRNKTIKQYKEDKEKAKELIKNYKKEIKRYETISKGDALKQADDYIKSLLITNADAIEKTKITIEALENKKGNK